MLNRKWFYNAYKVIFKDTQKDQHILFGVLMFLNYPIFYLLFKTWNSEHALVSLYIRSIASIICIPLILKNLWANSLKKYFNLYWFLAVTYCLPFFFTYMSLINNLSPIWLMNSISAIFFMLLAMNIIMFGLSLMLGVSIGILLYWIQYNSLAILANLNWVEVISTFAAAIIIGSIFSHNLERIHSERLHAMKTLAGTIAHEMRTPLSGILLAANAFRKYMPRFLNEEYGEPAKKEGVKHTTAIEILKKAPEDISALANSGLFIIDMLLTKLKENINFTSLFPVSIKACVEEALEQYPFSPGEEKLITIELKDFTFLGNKQLMLHIIFNLLKNALYYIEYARKGEIYITSHFGDKYNILVFKDTGPGIAKAVQKRIFEKFFTSSNHGTGLGLSFCRKVMESIGGQISCKSEEGSYTEFILTFPRIKEIK
jgi:signal transduction histidine kinase